MHSTHNATLDDSHVAVQAPPWPVSAAFAWSHAKLRCAAWKTLAATAPAVPLVFAANTAVSALGLAYLALIALRCEVLSRRVRQPSPVLLIGPSGIADMRTGLRLRWQDVSRIWRINADTARVIDIEVRWPKELLSHTAPTIRLGARCQLASGLPAVSISFSMLDGSVEDILAAIRAVRPDLLHGSNKSEPNVAEAALKRARIALPVTSHRASRR